MAHDAGPARSCFRVVCILQRPFWLGLARAACLRAWNGSSRPSGVVDLKVLSAGFSFGAGGLLGMRAIVIVAFFALFGPFAGFDLRGCLV